MTSFVVCLMVISLAAPTPIVPQQKAAEDKDADTFTIETLKMAFPVTVRADKAAEIKEIRLYMSDNKGKSWKRMSAVKPDKKSIVFRAPQAGLYWFRLQVVFNSGKCEPAEIKGDTADQKILVKPRIAQTASTGPDSR